jgi:hypothetical protein
LRWGPFNFSRCDVVDMITPNIRDLDAGCQRIASLKL